MREIDLKKLTDREIVKLMGILDDNANELSRSDYLLERSGVSMFLLEIADVLLEELKRRGPK